MTIRFPADEDLPARLRGRKDPVLLNLAFRQNRIPITHDRNTMTRFCKERAAAGKLNPGIIIVPQMSGIGEIIEELLLLWTASHTEEWRNQIVYSPFR